MIGSLTADERNKPELLAAEPSRRHRVGSGSGHTSVEVDKVLADLYGTQYGLRESFLSYVYPDRSLGRLIPADLKATFSDLYKKELEMALLDFKGLSVGTYTLDKIKNRVAVSVLKSFQDVDTRGILEQLTLMRDKA